MGTVQRVLILWAVMASLSRARRNSAMVPWAVLEAKDVTDSMVETSSAAAHRDAIPSPDKLADACHEGIAAVNEAVSKFMETPPDIIGGIEVLNVKLWTIAEIVLPPQQLGTKKYAETKQSWEQAFKFIEDQSSSVERVQEIFHGIQQFQAVGNTTGLRTAIFRITEVPCQVLVEAFPEAEKYFDALHLLIDGAGKSWHLFFEGKPVEAMTAIYQGVNASLRYALPASVINHDSFHLVMGTVDGVLGDLNQHVVEYRRQIMESTVCYKNEVNRGKVRPSVCRDGFVWDGGHRCLPLPTKGADCWAPCGYQGGICPGFCSDGMVCCRRGFGNIFVKDPPECHGAYGYIDHSFTEHNSKEYHQCVYRAGYGIDDNEDDDASLLEEDDASLLEEEDDASLLEEERSLDANDFSGGSLDESETGEELNTADDLALARLDIPLVHRRRQVKGAYTAKCNMTTKYSEKHDNERYCVAKCPEGFHAKSNDKCEQLCSNAGRFKADGKLVCGTDPGEVTTTLLEMAGTAVWHTIQIGHLLLDMKDNGMDVDKLTKTINAFINLGKPFARPMCPMTQALLPDPNAEAGAKTAAFTIKDCGVKELNGKWFKNGWIRGRPQYEKIGSEDEVIEWSDSRKAWRMYIDSTWFGFGRRTLYLNKKNYMAPPANDWEVYMNNGVEPAPTLVWSKSAKELPQAA